MITCSLRQHKLSSALAVLSIATTVCLLVSVLSLREQTRGNFIRIGHGVDAVLGPKGSPLQIALNAVYHIEEMPGRIKWSYMKKVAASPLVEKAVPFCTGHSFGGFRVNAIEPEFFACFEYSEGMRFSFDEKDGGRGKIFSASNEAVAGAAAARELGFKTGSEFNPVCGVRQNDPAHDDRIKITGILAPTGTPHDRAIYIPLKTFYSLSGHGGSVAEMSLDEEHREISGAYIKLKRIREGAMHPGVQGLKYEINQSPAAQLVVPAEVLPRLFSIIGWVDGVLLAISTAVGILSMFYLFIILINSVYERKRDIALLRFLGVSRSALFAVVMGESMVITIAGSVIGYACGHLAVKFAGIYISSETGVRFYASYISNSELYLAPVIIIAALLAGLIPSIQSYRLDVIKNLRPLS